MNAFKLKYFHFQLCLISARQKPKSVFLMFHYLIMELLTFTREMCLNFILLNDLSVSKTHTYDS